MVHVTNPDDLNSIHNNMVKDNWLIHGVLWEVYLCLGTCMATHRHKIKYYLKSHADCIPSSKVV